MEFDTAADDAAKARAAAARHYIRAHRRQREISFNPSGYKRDLRMNVWATWERVRDETAVSIADDVARRGKPYDWDLAEYRVITDRMWQARGRWSAAYRASKAGAA